MMKPISETSTADLMDEAKRLHDAIFNIGCAGVTDTARLEALYAEITRRGYAVNEAYTVTFEESIYSMN